MWQQNVLPEYKECDGFNADTTGLTFKCLLDKTLAFKSLAGARLIDTGKSKLLFRIKSKYFKRFSCSKFLLF